MSHDTIVAIATALTNSGIGIIRVSGKDAIEIVDKIYRSKSGTQNLKDYKSHTINYGYIYNHNVLIDEVMVSIMMAPKSYTTEDTVEINCHGGILIMKSIIELLNKNGARNAEPGEFTKRAFLNGRIDLTKAEAVMDIINAKNEMALNSSINQLTGILSNKIKEIRSQIIYEIAFIESALDDPEHFSLDGYYNKLSYKIESIADELTKLIKSSDNGKLLKEGIKTVIIGKPNAGKSSLLNRLIGEDRAIVTDIEGTTRDVLEETIQLKGISLRIIDTAGIRQTEDVVEKIGVEKAKKFAEEADLIICIIDGSKPLDKNDFEILNIIENKKCIILLNKSDLEKEIEEEYISQYFKGRKIPIIKTSIINNKGIEEFENVVESMFFEGIIEANDQIVITNLRHKEALEEALSSIKSVYETIKLDMPEDFITIDLMNAYSKLGFIIGEEIADDLLEEIFTKFCLGK